MWGEESRKQRVRLRRDKGQERLVSSEKLLITASELLSEGSHMEETY